MLLENRCILYVKISAGQTEEFSFDTSDLSSLKLRVVSGPAKASAALSFGLRCLARQIKLLFLGREISRGVDGRLS